MAGRLLWFLCLLLPAAVSMDGCRAPGTAAHEAASSANHAGRERAKESPSDGTARSVPAARLFMAGRSVKDRPIACLVLGCGEDTVLFLASIHGNEQAGTPLLEKLAGRLLREPGLLEDRTVLIVPRANPDGMARSSRFNARGVDLNRNFAAANRRNGGRSGTKALSEPETLALARILRVFAPRRIVSIHQPLSLVDYDGPGRELAERTARSCGLPLRNLGARPGSLGSFAGVDLGIPIITLELPEDSSRLSAEELWRRYGPGLIAVILFPEKGGRPSI